MADVPAQAMHNVAPGSWRHHAPLAALFCILIGSVLLRLVNLTSQAIWYDEATLIYLAKLDLFDRWRQLAHSQHFIYYGIGKAPLVVSLLRVWLWLFGPGEAAVRSLFLVIGSASLIPTFLLARRLATSRTALFCVLLVGLNPFHIYYSQQVSEYILVFFFTALSMFMWLRLEERCTPTRVASLLICNLMGLLCHPLFAFVAAIQMLLDLPAMRASGLWPRLLNLVPLGLFGLYVAALTLGSERRLIPENLGWIQPLGLESLELLFRQLLHGPMSHGDLCLQEIQVSGILLLHILLGLGLGLMGLGLGAALLGRSALARPRRALLLCWLLLQAGVMAGYSLVVDSIFVPRYLTALLPLLLLLMALGLDRLWQNERALGLLVTLLLAGLLLAATGLQHFAIPRGSLREAAHKVEQELRPDDGLILAPDRLVLPFAYYFDGDLVGWSRRAEALQREIDPGHPWLTNKIDDADWRLQWQPQFAGWLEGKRRLWLLVLEGWPGDRQTAGLKRELKRRLRVRGRWFYAYSGVELLLLEPSRGR